MNQRLADLLQQRGIATPAPDAAPNTSSKPAAAMGMSTRATDIAIIESFSVLLFSPS